MCQNNLLLLCCPVLCFVVFLQVYSADEAFATGTFAGVLPVVEVDGRRIGTGGLWTGSLVGPHMTASLYMPV
jgi:hypothetical protein